MLFVVSVYFVLAALELGFSNGTLERRYSRIMLSPPQNMKPYLGHYARIMRAYSLLHVLLCVLIVLAALERPVGAGHQDDAGMRRVPCDAVQAVACGVCELHYYYYYYYYY